jgi:hypothetical protein
VPLAISIPNGYALERLDTSRHSRENFSCGKPELDVFLRTQASQAQSKYLSATHAVIRTEMTSEGLYPIAGYVTLVSSEIPLSECPPAFKKVTNRERLPILLLARMASDLAYKGNRIGECLLKFALIKALEMNQNSGCAALFMDAKDEDSKAFYLKYDFTPLLDRPMRLFLPVAKIEKLI